VFGDSYAEKGYAGELEPVIWYSLLEKEYGHTVDCFGESGSSILFSAKSIKQCARDYDLVIWCVTVPGRFSFLQQSKDHGYHIGTSMDKCDSTDPDLIKKHKVCVDYLKYAFDWEAEILVGESVVSYLQSQFSNIMIIPCFFPPLHHEFNLYELTQQETNHYFPEKTVQEVYKKYQDLRPGHITTENQKILAKLINDNLIPGVFQTTYDNFIKPTASFEQVFTPL